MYESILAEAFFSIILISIGVCFGLAARDAKREADESKKRMNDKWINYIDRPANEQEFKDQYLGSWEPCANYCKKTGTCKSPFDKRGLCECGAIDQKKPNRR